MENSFPEGVSLHTHHEKLFITQKETRTDQLFYYLINVCHFMTPEKETTAK